MTTRIILGMKNAVDFSDITSGTIYMLPMC
jgi:hypothetical protein